MAKRNFIKRRIEITSFSKEEQIRYKDEVDMAFKKIKIKMEDAQKKRFKEEKRTREKEIIAFHNKSKIDGVQRRCDDKNKPFVAEPYRGPKPTYDENGVLLV